MSSPHTLTLTLDRHLLRHPRAYHLRRMRLGLWVYLDLLARLPAGADSLELDPAAVAGEMGVHEGFVRSWLGHLHHAGYVESTRQSGALRVRIKRGFLPEAQEPTRERYFTVRRLQRALKDSLNVELFEAALRDHSDTVIRRALAGTLAVPDGQIRRSRTALFTYLLKRYAHAKD